jgi:hypothetical protein
MFYRIESYSYDRAALETLRKTGVLNVEPDGYVELSLSEYIAMRKSLSMAEKYLRLQKAKISVPVGARWITVHPNGRGNEGQPVLIQESGNGTAHVIAGAGGRLNGLKLNKIKSKEEYRQIIAELKEKEKTQKMKEKLEEQEQIARMSPEERREYKQQKKLAKEIKKTREQELQEKEQKAKQEFVSYVASEMGWQIIDYDKKFSAKLADLQRQLANAEESGDKAEKARLKKQIDLLEKAKKRAKKSQMANLLAVTKDSVRSIERELIIDPELREKVLVEVENTAPAIEEVIKKENAGNSLGFATKYRNEAEEKGLSDEDLEKRKKEEFTKRINEIAADDPRTANMIMKGIMTNEQIAAAKNQIYEEDNAPIKPIQDADKKVEMLKKYLEMKKTLRYIKGKKDVQVNLDGTIEDAEESAEDIEYGKGVELSYSELLDADIEDEAQAMLTERQAAIHSSLLETIKKNPGGAGKWIANGNYAGLNSIALAALGVEGLDRDVVDVLGIGASAKLLAMEARQSMSSEDYDDFANAMEKYHQGVNETIAREAVTKGNELLARAESIQAEIDANPNDLAAVAELNEQRLKYLDEANRIVGQALGSLEASAAMVVELKNKNNPDLIEVALGKILTEDAIIRLHAIGLSASDYELSTVDGTKFAKISNLQKLMQFADPTDLKIEREVEQIKAGLKDEPGWMPAGLVRRSTESFEDPGPDAEYAATSVENQSLADDAQGIEKTEEAVHRTLGMLPEGRFAFKDVEDLTAEEQTDLRRYWERHIYKGSMAERTAMRDMVTGKVISRQAAWQQFLRGKCADDKTVAFEAIKNDLIENHSTEDMFGIADIPPLARVVQGDWKTYRGNVDGAEALFQEIEELRDPATVINKEAAEREAQRLEEELPERLTELYESQMRDHYLKWMSGYSEEQLDAGAEREEQTPWGEYVRMHGDTKRAQAAVLDIIKGDFIDKFTKQYARVTKKKLQTKVEKIHNWQDHVLGMLDKQMRDSVINKVQAELASAGASVANRSARGQFALGSWKEKALEYLEQKKREDAAQAELFGGEELKQDDGTEILSIGKRAEAQLASIVPQLAVNQRRGQKFNVSTMDTRGERQRAIKMFETVGRMNLTFGTGKGKTILSIGAFTDLHEQGKAKRAIFAVPSAVQGQFGNEVNVFCKPGKYHIKSDPSLNQEERIQALKDGRLDMVVCTHESLRNDLIHVMARHNGDISDEAMQKRFNGMNQEERRDTLRAAMQAEGIAFDMLTVDESHYTVNRKGKEDTTLSNVLDALNQNVKYFMNQSATPVKNDASEAFDMLHKVAPDKFDDRDSFLKKYGVDTEFSRRSLQRLINRYNYASRTVTGTVRHDTRHNIQLTPEQRAEYDKVTTMYQRASKAQREGRVDVEAMKFLSPNTFRGVSEEKQQELAERLQESVGIVKEEAYNRVINQFDYAHNAKIKETMRIVQSQVYQEDNPKTASKKGDKKPGVIFTHNIATLQNLQRGLEEQGLRVGIIQGSMNGAEKEKVKVGFNPPNPSDRIYDVLVCSDAGATGLNLQNAAYLVNFDLPQTSWVKQQREGRIDRPGQAHPEIEYHDLVSDTEQEHKRWQRIQRKKALGGIFEEDPGELDDTGLAATIAELKHDRYMQGLEQEKAA